MGPRLPLKKKLLFSTLVFVVTLALVATGLELWGWYHQPVLLRGALVESFQLNHTWRPNSEFVHDEFVGPHSPDFPEPYTHVFNAQGWLETYDVETLKPSDTYRIFYLGDSFTEGTVAMDRSVPSLVETELNRLAEQRGRPTRFEVVNTGTSSYSPLIYYVLLRHEILDYDPDLVVVQVDMTDDFDDWKYHETAIYDEHGDPWAIPPRNPYESAFFDSTEGVIEASLWTRLQLFLMRNSHFYNYLIRDSEEQQGPPPMATAGTNSDAVYHRWSWCKPTWDEHTRRHAQRTLATLGKIAKLCKQHDVKLLLTGVPHYPQYSRDLNGGLPPLWSHRPHDRIRRVAQTAGVAYFDSYRALLPHVRGTPQTRYYFHQDIHFNPRGYALWAGAQLEFLIDSRHQLLPSSFYD